MDPERKTQELEAMVVYLKKREEKVSRKYQDLKFLTEQQDAAIRAIIFPNTASREGEERSDYMRRLLNCLLQILENVQVYTDRRQSIYNWAEEKESKHSE